MTKNNPIVATRKAAVTTFDTFTKEGEVQPPEVEERQVLQEGRVLLRNPNIRTVRRILERRGFSEPELKIITRIARKSKRLPTISIGDLMESAQSGRLKQLRRTGGSIKMQRSAAFPANGKAELVAEVDEAIREISKSKNLKNPTTSELVLSTQENTNGEGKENALIHRGANVSAGRGDASRNPRGDSPDVIVRKINTATSNLSKAVSAVRKDPSDKQARKDMSRFQTEIERLTKRLSTRQNPVNVPYGLRTSARTPGDGAGFGGTRPEENVSAGRGDTSRNPASKLSRSERSRLTVPDQHMLRIARDTLKMPDAMVGVMGGPNKIEAREIIKRLTGKTPKENPTKNSERYRGVVKAGKGVLIGGVKEHVSIWFNTKKDAERWLEVIKEGNEDADRDVASATIQSKNPTARVPFGQRTSRRHPGDGAGFGETMRDKDTSAGRGDTSRNPSRTVDEWVKKFRDSSWTRPTDLIIPGSDFQGSFRLAGSSTIHPKGMLRTVTFSGPGNIPTLDKAKEIAVQVAKKLGIGAQTTSNKWLLKPKTEKNPLTTTSRTTRGKTHATPQRPGSSAGFSSIPRTDVNKTLTASDTRGEFGHQIILGGGTIKSSRGLKNPKNPRKRYRNPDYEEQAQGTCPGCGAINLVTKSESSLSCGGCGIGLTVAGR